MERREFLLGAAGMLGLPALEGASAAREAGSSAITLFLCGDVMTGRGIDQLLARPSEPTLFESYVRDARRYVELAAAVSGPIARPVDPSYVWGEALAELDRRRPDARIVNLETAVTTSSDPWPRKGIHYRMHPANVGCLTAAAIDCCVLANNHVLDWGYAGLAETVPALRGAGLATVGAGGDLAQATAPAILEVAGKGRVVVFAYGLPTSGIPAAWAAAAERPGVSFLPDLSEAAAESIASRIAGLEKQGDVVVVSIHWGGNWGHAIPDEHQRFARLLIDTAAVDVVHGHSSHHPLGVEIYRGRPILYGCGDFINDYEGIGGHERYRADLVLAWFLTLDPASGRLLRLAAVPFQSRRLRLERPTVEDAAWLRATLDRESSALGARVEAEPDGSLAWRPTDPHPRDPRAAGPS